MQGELCRDCPANYAGICALYLSLIGAYGAKREGDLEFWIKMIAFREKLRHN